MSSLLTTTTYATLNDLPCEMMLSIFCLCTSYAELFNLSMVSKTWRMTYSSMKPIILAAVTKNIVGPDAFDNLVIVLRYQRHTTIDEHGIQVVDYPSVKASMSERFVFNPEYCELVMENQRHYKQASSVFNSSLSWEHQYDVKLSTYYVSDKELPMALFFEIWVAALRYGLESLADWSKHEENKEPMDNDKFLKYRVAAPCMLAGGFVAAPHWDKGAYSTYQERGSENGFFDVLLRAYGAEGHVMQLTKCASHYTGLLSANANGGLYSYNFVEFYDFLDRNSLEKVIEKYDLDGGWL